VSTASPSAQATAGVLTPISGGARAGRQAGRLRAADESVRIVAAKDGPDYAQHTTAGSLAAKAGMARWAIEWTAPADGDAVPVVFDVAANASNADQSALGDYIYTARATSAPEGRALARAGGCSNYRGTPAGAAATPGPSRGWSQPCSR
jgi:hypothetical protein